MEDTCGDCCLFYFSLSPYRSIHFHCPIGSPPHPHPHRTSVRQRVHSGEQTHWPRIDVGRCQIHVLWKTSMLVGGTWLRWVLHWSTAGLCKLCTTAAGSNSPWNCFSRSLLQQRLQEIVGSVLYEKKKNNALDDTRSKKLLGSLLLLVLLLLFTFFLLERTGGDLKRWFSFLPRC